MNLIRKFKTVSLLGLVFILAFGMIGCGDDSKSTAVTNPSSSNLNPTGTIQGILTDASTAQPIVGAVIDIGVSRATTSANGQFVIYNVPVTEDATVDGANGDTFSGSYEVTIDMRNVTSPVNMTSATATPRYGDFYFEDANVIFSSLNDTDANYGGDLTTYESATNHDTPVTGLVASQNFMVGKMSATLTGVVAGCATLSGGIYIPKSGNEADFYDLKEGVTVLLLATGGSSPDDTASGNSGNLVAATATDANGVFTFANIESGQTFQLIAKSADGMSDNSSGMSISAIGDGLTTSLVLEKSTAVHICTADVHGPTIIAQSVENGSDIAPSTTQAVTFTFSEAVKDTAYSDVSGSPVSNLLDNIHVYWGANKAATAVAFSAAWNTAMDQLTVTFPTAGSSLYWVRIMNIGSLTDANLVAADRGVCVDDGSVPAAWNVADIGANAGTDDPTVYFTTYAGRTVTAPSAVSLVNATTINFNTAPILDWNKVPGAKGYNVYRMAREIWSDGSTIDDYKVFAGTTTVSAFTDAALSFVENNEVQLVYFYTVTTLNSDDVESAESTVEVNAVDVVGPSITNGDTTGAEAAFLASAPIPTALGESATANFVLTFGEPLDEASAETLSNYSVGKIFGAAATDVAPVISNPVYNETAYTVTLTLTITRASGADTFTDDFYISTTVTDVAGNTAASTGDLWDYNAGAAQ